MRGAAVVVDVAAVGLVGDDPDVGAEAAEDLRRGAERRAVGAVEQDPAAGQVEVLEALVQRAQVVLERAVEGAHAAGMLGDRRRLLEHRLDLGLGGVRQLVAVAAEELDPVVLVRVVRGRQHDREVEPVTLDQQRRAGRRQDAAEQRLAPGRGDARGDGGLEHLARLARVPDDQDTRGVVGRDARGGRAGEREGQFGRQELARDTAHTVGAEELAGGAGWRRAH